MVIIINSKKNVKKEEKKLCVYNKKKIVDIVSSFSTKDAAVLTLVTTSALYRPLPPRPMLFCYSPPPHPSD